MIQEFAVFQSLICFYPLNQVSYSLLIFFCGMFITVDGFNKTGIPGKVWDIMEPYSQVDRAGGIAILALVILVLSNLVSNVPTGMDSAAILVSNLLSHYMKAVIRQDFLGYLYIILQVSLKLEVSYHSSYTS